ncbi:MAG: efflux RND transporter permease subunit [Candidatus Scalinduaceae bacterium]
MAKKIIEWCVENRFLVCIISTVVIVIGIWSVATIKIDAIPDLSDVQVIIYTPWMGRDPQTIEDQVTYPISTAMLSVPMVKDVRGYSFFGFSFVYIIFEDGTDMYWARSRVLEYLNQVQGQLPSGITPSLGPDASGLGWVFIYTLEDTKGKYDLGELRALQDWYVRYQLVSVPGVAEVATVGGAVRQYQVTVDPNKLLQYQIPLKRVIKSIQKSNNDVGGRVVEIAETEFMVRGRGYIKNIEDIEEVVIHSSSDGTPVLLRDVAQVAMGPDIKRGIAEKNGLGEVVAGIVVMRYGENALKTIDAVKKKIRQIESGLPEGVVIKKAYDRSPLIRRSINTLEHQLVEEMIIVALICVIFLLHVRSALVSAITLPIGILISFIVMKAMGIGANIMSLGGIAIAIGAMVDASVVMVENVHKHKEREDREKDHWKLVIKASQEVGPSLFFSLLVITVSFLPVFALQDQAGRLFKPLAYTKTFAMAGSAFVAIILIPVLMGFFIRGKTYPESRNPVSRFLIACYSPVIHFSLKRKKTIVVIAMLILIATFFIYRRLGSEFMPPLREGDILYMPTTVPGLSVTEARRTLQIQDRLLSQYPEVEVVLGKIGRADTSTDPAPLSMVETHVSLRPEEEWPERIIKKGYLKKITHGILKGIEKNHIIKPVSSYSHISNKVEQQVWWDINAYIRESLLTGKRAEEIRKDISEKVTHKLSEALKSLLLSERVLDTEKIKDMESYIEKHWNGNLGLNIPLRRITFDELTKEEMNRNIQIPGMPNWWLMPIETRIGMLTTGMRGVLGLKLYGTDLNELERLGPELEKILKTIPGTLSVVAERAMQGNYIDININRKECARYGLTVDDVQQVIETAIGGKNITQTIEGRYRFPVNVRYPSELRDDPEKIKRTLVFTPGMEQIPLEQLADIELTNGPPMIKSENGLLLVNIPVDLEAGVDIGSYVKNAQTVINRAIEQGNLTLPSGYYFAWSGQYQFMEEVNKRLKTIIPVTLVLIFILIYFSMQNIIETLIIMVTLPFALVGGIWYIYFLGYNWSTAVSIGFIALAGLAAETGIIMLVYLDLAHKKYISPGRALTEKSLKDTIIEGAVMRVRPIMMTVMTTIMGLLPIMWAMGVGSGPMKRMAAPMIGGLVSSAVLTLVLVPVFYSIYKGFHIKK